MSCADILIGDLVFSKHEIVCNLISSTSCVICEHVDWELDASCGLDLGWHKVMCDLVYEKSYMRPCIQKEVVFGLEQARSCATLKSK